MHGDRRDFTGKEPRCTPTIPHPRGVRVPDSPETRIGRLEREVAALRQQVSDVAHDVDSLNELDRAVVRIQTTLEQVERELVAVRQAMAQDREAAVTAAKELQEEIKGMRKEQLDQSRANKTQIWAAVSALAVAFVTAAGGVIAAGGIG